MHALAAAATAFIKPEMSALTLNNPQCGPMPAKYALGSKLLYIKMPKSSEQIGVCLYIVLIAKPTKQDESNLKETCRKCGKESKLPLSFFLGSSKFWNIKQSQGSTLKK